MLLPYIFERNKVSHLKTILLSTFCLSPVGFLFVTSAYTTSCYFRPSQASLLQMMVQTLSSVICQNRMTRRNWIKTFSLVLYSISENW